MILLALAATVSPWSLKTNVDPITDAGSAQLALRSGENGVVFLCKAGEMNPTFGLMSNDYLGGRPILRAVTWRFDKTPPVTENWAYGNHYAFRQGSSFDLVDAMADASTLTIRAYDYRSGPVDVTVSLDGSKKHLADFKDACRKVGAGW